jgi:succinate-semialdehyde dehydrogenase / glutarate-semialdehyde dehydrogenase
MTTFKSIFPYTQEVIEEYPLMDNTAINQAIQSAEKAYPVWRLKSFDERATVLKNVAAILNRDRDTLATLITNEMGKVIAEARGEIEKCAGTCEYYAEHAEKFLKDELADAGYTKSFVSFKPIGAVLAIMPWNFPFWQVFRYAAPTLMAGNVTLLKHSPNVCGCAKAIEQLFIEAGAPPGVFQTLIIDTPAVEKLLEQKIVQAVTLTGSEKAGSAVAAIAGKNIKKSVLELGGSDVLIVLPDADMKNAAAVALQSRMQNAGQSCIGAKRFIVLQEAQNAFMQEFFAMTSKLKQGDPFDAAVTTGPMARLDLVENLQKQLMQSVASGAQLAFGGETNGCNFNPAILLNVKPGMPAFEQETFGPMAAITIAKNEGEAIDLANQSDYGLAGSIWTADIEKGMALARKLNTGAVFVNALVKSDPRLPFGGIKKSGYGRELGRHGMLEFVNVKTIAAMQ